MLTIASTEREAEPPGSGALDDPFPRKGLGRDRDRAEAVTRSLGERLGARRALVAAEDLHHRPADLPRAPLEGGLATAGWPAAPAGATEAASGRERTAVAPRRRPAVEATQVHQCLVPFARCGRIDPGLRVPRQHARGHFVRLATVERP